MCSRARRIAGGDTAALIDEIPVLAAIAPYTTDGIEIRDARELSALKNPTVSPLCRQIFAPWVQKSKNSTTACAFRVDKSFTELALDSFGDHRIAMAFAVAALRAEGETEISGADAAVISYPEFFNTLESLVQR